MTLVAPLWPEKEWFADRVVVNYELNMELNWN